MLPQPTSTEANKCDCFESPFTTSECGCQLHHSVKKYKCLNTVAPPTNTEAGACVQLQQRPRSHHDQLRPFVHSQLRLSLEPGRKDGWVLWGTTNAWCFSSNDNLHSYENLPLCVWTWDAQTLILLKEGSYLSGHFNPRVQHPKMVVKFLGSTTSMIRDK